MVYLCNGRQFVMFFFYSIAGKIKLHVGEKVHFDDVIFSLSSAYYDRVRADYSPCCHAFYIHFKSLCLFLSLCVSVFFMPPSPPHSPISVDILLQKVQYTTFFSTDVQSIDLAKSMKLLLPKTKKHVGKPGGRGEASNAQFIANEKKKKQKQQLIVGGLQLDGRYVSVNDVYNIRVVQKRWRASLARIKVQREAAATIAAQASEPVVTVASTGSAHEDSAYGCGHAAENSSVLGLLQFRYMLFTKKRQVFA